MTACDPKPTFEIVKSGIVDPQAEQSSPELVEAVRLWTGHGRAPAPRFDDSLVAKHFGQDAADRLLPLVIKLHDDYHSSDAMLRAESMQEQIEMAEQGFRGRYPNVPQSIIDALSWCYAFSNR